MPNEIKPPTLSEMKEYLASDKSPKVLSIKDVKKP